MTLIIVTTSVLAQENDEDMQVHIEQLQKMQEMQEKSLQNLTNAMPTMSGFLNTMMGFAQKLEGMEKDRSELVHKRTKELDAKVEYVLELIDDGKISRAKLKALSIKWTAIGQSKIDEERTKHFDSIREELLALINAS